MKKNRLNERNKKIETLFEGLQESGFPKLQSNPEYIEANNALMNALNILKKDMPDEKVKQLIKFDDAAVTLNGILFREYYKKGYADAHN